MMLKATQFLVALALSICAVPAGQAAEDIAKSTPKLDKDAATQIMIDSGYYGFGALTMDTKGNWRATAIQHGVVTIITVDQGGVLRVQPARP